MENDRINDDTEITVLQVMLEQSLLCLSFRVAHLIATLLAVVIVQGNTGKDDEVVQTYEVQASEGDVGSMLALGEMNYFGTRGIPRVRPRDAMFC